MIIIGSQGGLGGMSPPMKKHLELEIKTLENAPRDPDKLERLLQIRQRQKEEAMYIDDTQRLVTEIEMLKVVLHLDNEVEKSTFLLEAMKPNSLICKQCFNTLCLSPSRLQ